MMINLKRTIAELDQQSVEAIYYHVQWTGLSTAVILTTGTSNRYAVDTSKKECSCGFYQEDLIPCRHAIKFLTSIGSDPNIVVMIFILLNIWDRCMQKELIIYVWL